jgi:CheY-like chemotaxis protein
MTPRVLLIDDNPLNLKLARCVLEDAGFFVVSAASAELAAEQLRDPLPDLVLVDLALPGIDGLEFARRLRADPRTRSIPIAAMTAFAMQGDEAKARAAGCDLYITKPVDTRLLGARLRGLLPIPSQPPAS